MSSLLSQSSGESPLSNNELKGASGRLMDVRIDTQLDLLLNKGIMSIDIVLAPWQVHSTCVVSGAVSLSLIEFRKLLTGWLGCPMGINRQTEQRIPCPLSDMLMK